jgi:hypothetical protein
MKANLSHLDTWRTVHPLTSYIQAGDTCGVFYIPHQDQFQRVHFGAHYVVISNDGKECGWDHVSIHVRRVKGKKQILATPTWEDMAYIKSLFFEDTETVMQLHVPPSDHINVHDHVLHLWRPLDVPIPTPPLLYV